MTEPQTVTIVVPVFNGERFLGETLDSMFAQGYPALEVIIVDDGSTDSTAEVARSYPSVRYVYQENQGDAGARNTGLAHATGDLLGFLDADDLWVPNKLQPQLDFLAANPQYGGTVARLRNFMDPNWPRSDAAALAILENQSLALSLGSLVFHRWVLDKVGGFDTTLKHASDLDWFVRAHELGVRIAARPETLVLRRLHSSNYSLDNRLATRERIRVLRAHLQRTRSQVPEY